jgi:cation diffusion facilitator family transporter
MTPSSDMARLLDCSPMAILKISGRSGDRAGGAMSKVYVKYQKTRDGLNALRYAHDAARLFSDEPLVVLVARDPRAESVLHSAFAKAETALVDNVAEAVREFLGDANAAFVVEPFDQTSGPEIPSDAILIDPVPDEDADYACIYPANESSVEGRGHGPVMITFSDGVTGLVAAEALFKLIEKWRRVRNFGQSEPDVVFYHTTWPDPDAPSSDPVDHLCETAIRIKLALEQAARDHSITYKTIIETHRDVATGVIEAAHREGAVMIAMDRSDEVSQGSYVDQTVEQSPVPVYIVAPHTKQIADPADYPAVTEHYRERRGIISSMAKVKERGWLSAKLMSVACNPLFVMGLVAAMYVYKGYSKITVGGWAGLPTLLPDGLHNAIADLPQALFVAVAIIVATRPATQDYHWGRKNIEAFVSVGIGIALFGTAGYFIKDCVVGLWESLVALLHYWTAGDAFVREHLPAWLLPEMPNNHLTSTQFWWVLAVSASSMALSFFVSQYQIVIGKRTKHESMVADGKETRSDGLIEAVTIVGIIAEVTTGWRWVEFPLGLFVAYLVCKTAYELFMNGWHVLLQRSIGKEIEDSLRDAAMRVAGVLSVTELKTMQSGHEAVVVMTVESRARSAALPYIYKAAKQALENCVLDPSSEFKSADIHVKLNRPDFANSRMGLPLVMLNKDVGYVASSLATATHIAVCDVVDPEVVRTKVVALAGKDIPALLVEKRFDELALLDPADADTRALVAQAKARAAKTRQADILPDTNVVQATTYTLAPLGVKVKRARQVTTVVAA